jgi:hypothetical protein
MLKRFVCLASLTVAVSAASSAAAAPGPIITQQASFAGASNAFFGYAVSIDADTAVVGAMNDNSTKGAAYVYVRNGTTWSQQQMITAADGAANDEFGYAVALSGDRLLVNAAGKASSQGYVYAFTRTNGVWTQQAEFTAGDGAAGDGFGTALALRGTTAVIGANGKALLTGATYFFAVQGASWNQQLEFAGQGVGDSYGFSVALSQDGSTAVVGAYGANTETGKAYVYTPSASTWSQQAILTATVGAQHDRFGYSVSVDGSLAMIGAYGHNGNQGAAYVFARNASGWFQQSFLSAQDGAANDFFGYAVALTGNNAVIGAYEKSGIFGPGEAYAFSLSGSQWAQTKIVPTTAGQYFGYSVGISGVTIAVGGFGASNDSGAASVFQLMPPVVPALGGSTRVAALALLLAAAGLAFRRRSDFRRGPQGGVHAS